MWSIGKLRIQLPDGYRERATLISRMVAEELAERPPGQSLELERLSVPAVHIQPGTSDRQIARSIATAIHGRLDQEKE